MYSMAGFGGLRATRKAGRRGAPAETTNAMTKYAQGTWL
jgi:hypothetical protein